MLGNCILYSVLCRQGRNWRNGGNSGNYGEWTKGNYSTELGKPLGRLRSKTADEFFVQRIHHH